MGPGLMTMSWCYLKLAFSCTLVHMTVYCCCLTQALVTATQGHEPHLLSFDERWLTWESNRGPPLLPGLMAASV